MEVRDEGPRLLVLNAGSSSLKFGLYAVEGHSPVEQLGGSIESQSEEYRIELTTPQKRSISVISSSPLDALYSIPQIQNTPRPVAVGHRVVHGGLGLHRHTRIDNQVLRQLEVASVFAPLHVPPALRLILDARERFPQATQVACLDTVFHSTLPDVARVLPLPLTIRSCGVERIGFHGLSCESIVHTLGDSCPARLVIAHLGSGCSVTAVRDGHSIDTSMGLTPTGGVMMGTRPGDVDPGVLIYLLRTKKCTLGDLEEMLEHRAGLLGVSNESSDVHALEENSHSNPLAVLALTQFVRSIAKSIAGMLVSLGGADLLVFTGGIGEHASTLRNRIITELSPFAAALPTLVIPARENDCIARHAYQYLAN